MEFVKGIHAPWDQHAIGAQSRLYSMIEYARVLVYPWYGGHLMPLAPFSEVGGETDINARKSKILQ